MPKSKTKKLSSKKKLNFRSPVAIAILSLFVAVGIFFAFQTLASDGTTVVAQGGTKDSYGCPLDYKKRPTLRNGSSGACVQTLQSRFVTLGYIKKKDIDGIFGVRTDTYVRYFQSTWFSPNPILQVDGVVGPQTWYGLDYAIGLRPAQ